MPAQRRGGCGGCGGGCGCCTDRASARSISGGVHSTGLNAECASACACVAVGPVVLACLCAVASMPLAVADATGAAFFTAADGGITAVPHRAASVPKGEEASALSSCADAGEKMP
eukprot:2293435-Pleurochrysis_carterae.AAC.3